MEYLLRVAIYRRKGDDNLSHAKKLTEQFNTFHTYTNLYDDELDSWLHQLYADVLKDKKRLDWSKVYFSPSSADECPRALYHKAKKAKKDPQVWLPHQRRWVEIGTGIGDMVQRELLLMGRHYKKFTGEEPTYTVGMVDGKPAFEDFIYADHLVKHNGEEFYLRGTSDGILSVTGSDKLVGLEVKSKQQTPSKTSLTAMKEPQESHVKQITAYSIMYDLEDYVIMYVNTAHKSWEMTEDEFKKTPDIRLFDVKVTEEDKTDLLDYFADIARRVREDDPPLPVMAKWKFNSYKNAIAESITDDEMERLKMVNGFLKEAQPVWMHKQIDMAMSDLNKRRDAIKNA